MTDLDQIASDNIETLNQGTQVQELESQDIAQAESESDTSYESSEHGTAESNTAYDNDFLARELQEIKRQLLEVGRAQSQSHQANYQNQEQDYASTPKDIVLQALEEIKQDQKKIQYQRFQQEYEMKLASAPSRFRDFENTVFKNGSHSFSDEMIEILKSSDDPVATIYHAAKHHSVELDRIRAMPNAPMQIREMVKLEEKIKASLKPRLVSRAPSPMQHDIGSAGTSAGDDVNSTSGMADWLRRRDSNRPT